MIRRLDTPEYWELRTTATPHYCVVTVHVLNHRTGEMNTRYRVAPMQPSDRSATVCGFVSRLAAQQAAERMEQEVWG